MLPRSLRGRSQRVPGSFGHDAATRIGEREEATLPDPLEAQAVFCDEPGPASVEVRLPNHHAPASSLKPFCFKELSGNYSKASSLG